ncbi:hypothetical protein COT65_01730 [Candidatus Shapirobacteria bacterium CG09_land_8_20_14_0_10_47_13]|uniref:Uncharacterized protein n=1 Tax=Candidatus Shapirobacteria bacterium CG09_land_8_20_14_0_10_47_13 TaxID=1974481 RepID=A0A2H0WMN6_9BACT|nr:MAG: hypothetical protein COT65_01730 [Candidatus Shapirobacteria bacterium CG09_land_8_20_14_0_10_47_13]
MNAHEKVSPAGERGQLVEAYRLVFRWLPELRTLASGYWSQIGLLNLEGPGASSAEESILRKTAVQMADILLDNPAFKGALEKTGADPINTAIQESLAMIDIIPDLKAGGKNFDRVGDFVVKDD